MYNINIYKSSSVYNTAANVTRELAILNKIARKEVVTIDFFANYCRIVGRRSRKITVPLYIQKDSQSLLLWITKKIASAWK